MTAENIAIDFVAYLKNNFLPAQDYQSSTHQFLTSDLLIQVEKHYGVTFDSQEDCSLDASFFVEKFKELGFSYCMLPGTAEMRWLFIEKKVSF